MRTAARLLAPLALLAPWSAARANVTGNLELQSSTTQNVNQPGVGTTSATLLTESLSLHYAGLPFGSSVAIATAGGGFSNVQGWGQGLQLSGRVYSFDASVGFLPRRAVPLRLYAGGSIEDGASGALASRGPGPSVLYGGALNLEPGSWTPGLRLEANETRGSRPGHDSMSDVQRRVVASGYGTTLGQRVNLALQLDDDHRDAAGDASNRAATLSLSSPFHQTTFLATQTHRNLQVAAAQPVPTIPPPQLPSGITDDRSLSANSDQRWSPIFSTQVGGRLAEAGADGGTGTIGDLRGGATWVPVRGTQQVTLSANGGRGFTRTHQTVGSAIDPNDPLHIQEVSGESWSAGGRASYGRALGPVNAGVAAGGDVNACNCGDLGNDGKTRQVDGTLTLSLLPTGRASAQIDYTLASVWAPEERGGDRLENRVRTTGRLGVGQSSSVSAGLSYDDGVREFFTIVPGPAPASPTGKTTIAQLVHERAVSGSVGLSTQVSRVTLSTELRHARGTVVTDGTPFVAGTPTQVRSQTSGYANASWSPFSGLGVQLQLVASRADLSNAPGSTAAGANAALVWRLGRVNASLQYQGAHMRFDGQPATFQQSIRTLLSRPFELWR